MIKTAITLGALFSSACNMALALTSGSLLDCYEFENSNASVHYLPAELREISGLAITANKTLLAHNDERTAIYEIDPHTGRVTASQADRGMNAGIDYEGIEATDTAVILVSSEGNFARTRYPLNRSPFEFWTSKLGKICEIEGLTTDGTENTLVLACKKIVKPKSKREIRLLAISPGQQKPEADEISTIIPKHHESGIKEFSGSGLAYYAPLNHYLVLSSKNQAIAEISDTGELLKLVALPKKLHRQPEGIVITANRELIIANEGGKGAGYLVHYTPDDKCPAVNDALSGAMDAAQ